MCKPLEEHPDKVRSVPEFMGKVIEFLTMAKRDNKGLDWSRNRKYEFDCGQVYEITVRRVK
jgi:hypothetical protein